MPYELSTFQLPSGSPCGQVVWKGVTTAEEAVQWLDAQVRRPA